jgi:hypothetical protein
MKKKIIGILVVILVISTTVIPVAAITDRYDIIVTSYNSDVPIWEVGDEWTYYFTESCDIDLAYSLSGDLTFKVVDDSGDSYILEGTSKPSGRFDLGIIGLKTTRFKPLTMKLRLQMKKTDLALENFREKFEGILLLTIGSFTLPIPIQLEFNVDVEINPPWVNIPFPLYDGKYGNLSSTEFWHTNSYLHLFLFGGRIPLLGPWNYSWPITPVPYRCSKEQITIQGRTFDVYNVSAECTEGSRFVSYYAEEVGNVVKEVTYIAWGGGGVRYSLILELKDWRYTP